MPNGFRAVLPADTSVSVDIKDGTAVVDFSNEFKTIKRRRTAHFAISHLDINAV